MWFFEKGPKLNFPTTPPGILGYDPKAVDALMARLKRQYEGEIQGLVTSGMLGATRFDKTPGGYQIPAVDAALARVADTFELREQTERLSRLGNKVIMSELAVLELELKRVLDLGAVGAFDYAKNGYRKSSVSKLLKSIAGFSQLDEIDTFVIRSAALGRAINGLDRDQVDEFLAAVTAAAVRLRITLKIAHFGPSE